MARQKTVSKPRLTPEAAMPADGKPTLKTISQISGLAVPTVSRALNDAPDIGHATKKIVREIADQIGYIPNRAGVRLRTGRTNVISLVMSTDHDNHTARLISAVAGGLDGTRFHLNVTPYFPNDDLLRPVRYIVETGSADAVILNQIEPEDPRIAYLMERGFPFVTHGRSNWSDKHAYYDYDNCAFAKIAVDMLHERGRKNILAIAPPSQQNYASHLIQGLQERSEQHGMQLSILDGVTSDSAGDEIIAGVARHLQAHRDTDAVIAVSTAAAMGAAVGIETCGLSVGKEVDIFAKEAYPFLKLFRADILVPPEDLAAAGQFLAQAAIQAIRQPELPPMQSLEVPKAS
jgi:LacI family transcriptional regulator